jgi:hypothetical protein
MIKSEKKLKDLSALLNKDNNILINEAIGLLRDELPFEGVIGTLVAYYDKTEDFAVRKTIEAFMNDIKDQTACNEVISEIRKPWKDETISMLVSSCWQSGLNYSEFSTDFAGVFVRGDYITAIECLTVIEESASELTVDVKSEIKRIITNSSSSFSHEKKPLTDELMAILER